MNLGVAMENYGVLDNYCRGTSPPTEFSMNGCKARQNMLHEIYNAGWCRSGATVAAKWKKCTKAENKVGFDAYTRQ